MTDLVIITNVPDQLANWRDSNTLVRSAFRVHGAANLSDPLKLAWVHRDVAEAALAAGALSEGVSGVKRVQGSVSGCPTAMDGTVRLRNALKSGAVVPRQVAC